MASTAAGSGRVATPGSLAVGASAGGVPALRELVAHLPAAIAAPVVVVLHIPRTRRAPWRRPGSRLAAGEHRAARHPPAARAHLRLSVRTGTSWWATAGCSCPPVRLPGAGAPRRRSLTRCCARRRRPSVPRAIGIVLSGTRDDGTDGLAAIAECGGAALVQDPAEAGYPDMPRSAPAPRVRCGGATGGRAGHRGLPVARTAEPSAGIVTVGGPGRAVSAVALGCCPPPRRGPSRGREGGVDEPVPAFEALLEHLKDQPRLRLHRIQALQPDAPGRPADGPGRRSPTTRSTSTTSSCTPTSSPRCSTRS